MIQPKSIKAQGQPFVWCCERKKSMCIHRGIRKQDSQQISMDH